jgi:hypothetical protein
VHQAFTSAPPALGQGAHPIAMTQYQNRPSYKRKTPMLNVRDHVLVVDVIKASMICFVDG